MKKSSLFIIMLLLMPMVFCDTVKDYVCIVHGKISEKNKEFLTKYRDDLSKSGYSSYAKDIDAYMEGTFGSGFVYQYGGSYYVITNRHVISEYETVTVVFENEDGSTSEFEDLQITASDDDVDIGIIALPGSFKRGSLPLNVKDLTDGDDVWSAGFPAAGGEPVWQLGKGIVSNSKARIKDLLKPEISTIIQHTAEIDGGNSGGPLLIKDSKSKSGFSVVGVNAWKALNRTNANYAIPAKLIDNVIKSSRSNASVSVSDRISDFAKTVADEETFVDVIKYISNKMVSEYGEAAFKRILSNPPSSTRTTLINTFVENPLFGLRASLAYLVYEEFHRVKPVSVPVVGETKNDNGIYTVTFNPDGKKPIKVKWVEEHGRLRIYEFEGKVSTASLQAAASGKGFHFRNVGLISVYGGYTILPEADSSGFDVQVNFNHGLFSYGLFFSKVSFDALLSSPEDSVLEYGNQDVSSLYGKHDFSSFGAAVALEVPMMINNFFIEPYGQIRVGVVNLFNDISPDFDELIFLSFGGGIYVGYKPSFRCAPFLRFSYNFTPYKFNDVEYTQHEITIGGGVRLL
ncbi:MAG: trypsin-like peptidase domain-containing protein [Spirochaetaceae bacterium]|nr:trypsin-like peptidase domain-containing protein [Spirochaetaceae bacterium]